LRLRHAPGPGAPDPEIEPALRQDVDLRRGYDVTARKQVLGDPNFVVVEVLNKLEMPQIGVEHLEAGPGSDFG
jgi:hypothetical protein